MATFEMEYDRGLALYDEAIEKAEEEIIGRGLSISTRPMNERNDFDNFPTMPHDLSALSPNGIQLYLGRFTAWYTYAIGQLKSAEGQRNAAEKQRTFAWSSIRKLKSGTVSDKDDAVRTDSRYMKVDAHYEHCDAKVRVYGAIVEGLKRDIETISRAATVEEFKSSTDSRTRRIESGRARSSFRSGRRQPDHEEQAPPPRKRNRGLDMFKKNR